MVNLKQWGHGPRLQHEGDGKPTRSVRLSVTAKIATDARPGGPVAKHQPSPGGLGDGSPRLWSAGGAVLNLGLPCVTRRKPRDLQFLYAVLDPNQKSGVCLRGKGRPKCS